MRYRDERWELCPVVAHSLGGTKRHVKTTTTILVEYSNIDTLWGLKKAPTQLQVPSSDPSSSVKDTGSHPAVFTFAFTHTSNHCPFSEGLEARASRALGSKQAFPSVTDATGGVGIHHADGESS